MREGLDLRYFCTGETACAWVQDVSNRPPGTTTQVHQAFQPDEGARASCPQPESTVSAWKG